MIHQYQNNGYHIVLDVNSGSVHVVDKIAYDVIGCLEAMNPAHTPETLKEEKTAEYLLEKLGDIYAEEDLRDLLEAVAELTAAGQLFTQDVYESYIGEVKERKTVVKALCLHIAHDCNLACKYCFAEEGEYHGRRALMSLEVGKKALDFLVANSGKRRNLEVDFFGGEPLMNWQVVKDLVAYGRELEKTNDKHFRFTLTTNGVLLNDEVQEFVNKEMDNVVLSLDGRKEVNDRMRPFRNGKGSYDLIVPKFQKLAESRNQEKYYIRGTFTRENLDFSEDVLHFADLGFEQISIEPVVGEDTDPYAIQKEDLPKIFAEYDKLAKYGRQRTGRQRVYVLPLYAGFRRRSLRGKTSVRMWFRNRISGSYALGRSVSVSSVVGQEEFLLGNVEEGITKPEIPEEFRGCSVYSKDSCRNCFARFYCSGGCMANSYKFHHTINDTYEVSCEMERRRVECAIMIKAALADQERMADHEEE